MSAFSQVPQRRLIILLLVGAIGVWSAAGCARNSGDAGQSDHQALVDRGQRIFSGTEAITGKINGHQEPLPSQVAKCVTCHTPSARPQDSDQLAPMLNASWLQQARPRRGGPAFAYTRDSLCQTMRTGMDPEYVILNRTMPRFDISEEQCSALWTFLTEKPANEKK